MTGTETTLAASTAVIVTILLTHFRAFAKRERRMGAIEARLAGIEEALRWIKKRLNGDQSS